MSLGRFAMPGPGSRYFGEDANRAQNQGSGLQISDLNLATMVI
jgi:hypothetical protein